MIINITSNETTIDYNVKAEEGDTIDNVFRAQAMILQVQGVLEEQVKKYLEENIEDDRDNDKNQ